MAQNAISYRIYDNNYGGMWKQTRVAYNGAAGAVTSLNTAMMADGTSLLVYNVRTGEGTDTTEVFYTLIDPEGDPVTTGRLTNNSGADTNAQVTTVGDQFIVGWYSESTADQQAQADGTAAKTHSIGLARINKNGSVDADFPESISGSGIGSDFRFSAPVNNYRLDNLSIVWSQQKESDAEEDAGKAQLRAVRFYQDGETIGVTAPVTITESGNHFTIDSFDTYTDYSNTVNAVLVGGDYSQVDGIGVYDTIDLSDLPVEIVNSDNESTNLLTILENDPAYSMQYAKGRFQPVAIEAYADKDLYSLMPGVPQPVQFTVINNGTQKISSIKADIGEQTEEFKDLDLMPGQTTVLTVTYNVPEVISDVD